jgi:taurine dioxygenase
MATASPRLKTKPLIDGFGVEISGVDVRTADKGTMAEVVSLLELHGAIVLRGQHLSPKEQFAFTSVFGTPADNPVLDFTVPEQPEIFIISNKVVDGRVIGDAEAGTAWHTDLNYDERPASYTILHSLEVPEEGSDTLLADACAAWKALPEDKQREIDDLKVHHSYANLVARSNREMTEEERREHPDVFHPLVRRHPADGRKALWGLSSTTPNGIVGMPNPDGKNLIRELMEFATQDRFVYRHKWQPGDILVWDNRCTMHRGTPFDKSKYDRLVHRSWIRG